MEEKDLKPCCYCKMKPIVSKRVTAGSKVIITGVKHNPKSKKCPRICNGGQHHHYQPDIWNKINQKILPVCPFCKSNKREYSLKPISLMAGSMMVYQVLCKSCGAAGPISDPLSPIEKSAERLWCNCESGVK